MNDIGNTRSKGKSYLLCSGHNSGEALSSKFSRLINLYISESLPESPAPTPVNIHVCNKQYYYKTTRSQHQHRNNQRTMIQDNGQRKLR